MGNSKRFFVLANCRYYPFLLCFLFCCLLLMISIFSFQGAAGSVPLFGWVPLARTRIARPYIRPLFGSEFPLHGRAMRAPTIFLSPAAYAAWWAQVPSHTLPGGLSASSSSFARSLRCMVAGLSHTLPGGLNASSSSFALRQRCCRGGLKFRVTLCLVA